MRRKEKPVLQYHSVTARIETERSGHDLAFNFNSIAPLILLSDLKTNRRSAFRNPEEPSGHEPGKPERSVLIIPDSVLAIGTDRAEIIFSEEILTGMRGERSKLGFTFAHPDTVYWFRGGLINTLLVLEEGVSHTSVYNTPFGTVEHQVRASRVRNDLLGSGEIEAEYACSLHGRQVESCRMRLSVRPTAENT